MIIKNNQANGNGGGVTMDDCSNLTISNSLIINNSTNARGAAIFNSSSNLNLIRLTVYGNSTSINQSEVMLISEMML